MASIASQSDVAPDSEAVRAGFYAIAYEWNDETIISIRGSDNIRLGSAFLNFISGGLLGDPTGEDVTNGYGVAFGSADGPQATLAIEFYRAVAESLGNGLESAV